MDDSFNAYINQFLVDSSADANTSAQSGASMDVDKANALGNDLLLQLLLNSVSSSTAATIDPSSLNGLAINNTNDLYSPAAIDTTALAAPAAADTPDNNPLLTAALLSALGPFQNAASTTAKSGQFASAAADMHGEEAMLIDNPLSATTQATVASESEHAISAALSLAKSSNIPASSSAQKAKATKQKAASRANGSTSKSSSAGAQKRAAAASTVNEATAPAKKKATTSSAASSAASTADVSAVNSSSLDPENMDEDELNNADFAAADEMDGIDLKSLTSKERRQLRNKISARNFRVRRKVYNQPGSRSSYA
ncbi:hypothetical protein BX070DRAFT_85082 [Coemansia spiralis]|nr:hypothetical protein BX070DRAFT_85082 [Coemansia spiralis]